MNENTSLLVFILILKILVLLSLPLYMIFVKEKIEKIRNIIIAGNVLLILMTVILSLLNNPYIINSSFRGINNNLRLKKYTDKYINITNNPNIVEKMEGDTTYLSTNNKKVYYYSNSQLPLSNKKIVCNGKENFFKNYGNGITAVATMLSTYSNENIDPIQVYNYAVSKDLFDCDTGVDVEILLSNMAAEKNLHVINIDKDDIENYISSGGVVLAKTVPNAEINNVSCFNSSIIIYKIDNELNYKILNPSDKTYDYICPDNSKIYGNIVKANTNDISWSKSNLNFLSESYLSLERN